MGLIGLGAFSQNSYSEDSYEVLSKRKDSLLFSFYSSKTQVNIVLETNGKDKSTFTINAEETQRIIDVFDELGLLKINHLIPANKPEFEYRFDESTNLLVIIGRDDFDFYLIIRDPEIA